MQKKGVAVVAVGGNALIKDKDHETIQDQFVAASDTTAHIADMILAGWDVVITHGNGPRLVSTCAVPNSPKTKSLKSPLTTVVLIHKAPSAICSPRLCITSSVVVAFKSKLSRLLPKPLLTTMTPPSKTPPNRLAPLWMKPPPKNAPTKMAGPWLKMPAELATCGAITHSPAHC